MGSGVKTVNLMGKSEIRNCNFNELKLSSVQHRRGEGGRGERIVISLSIFEQ